MGHEITLNIPDEIHQILERNAKRAQWTPEELAAALLETVVRNQDKDPLLRLAGCIDTEAGDAIERHDEWFGHSLTEEEELKTRAGGCA